MFIVPTSDTQFPSPGRGRTLAAFVQYTLCTGQQVSAALGYAPLPVNLVQAGFDQLEKIPGAEVAAIKIATCNNPTFSPDGSNLFAQIAPMPEPCDALGVLQCATGTGGLKDVPTAVVTPTTTSSTPASTTTTLVTNTAPTTSVSANTFPPTTLVADNAGASPVGGSSATGRTVTSSGQNLPTAGGSTTPKLLLGGLLVVVGRMLVLVRRPSRPRHGST